MREYGKVSPQFWIGETGKQLRGDAETQLLALYLMTSPHSTMTGVFHCPVLYMGHDTGLGLEGASKGLRRLIEVGFCAYDEASETVFVVRMAAYQIGESLSPDDKRVKGLRNELARMPESRMKSRFLSVYGQAFHLLDGEREDAEEDDIGSPSEAPSKPRAGAGARTGEENTTSGRPDDPPPGFVRFWAAWPRSSRKVAKAECLKRWCKRGLESQADGIVGHVVAMKATKQWRDGYEPAPLTYLNQSRWLDGEAEQAPSDAPWYVRAGFGDEHSAVAAGAKPEVVA